MLKAVFFDQDGVIVDTERDGHRVAFNRAFREFGLATEWDVATYGELLKIGGGKERMLAYFGAHDVGQPKDPQALAELVDRLHERKTAIFVGLIESAVLPLRPGIGRLMREANAKGLRIGICTTSNEKAAHAISNTLLKGIRIDIILAGDIVRRKKPDPEIYFLALERSGLLPSECVVVEDSSNGVAAARGAGLHVLATANEYTMREDLGGADAVVTCLGDPPDAPAALLRGGEGVVANGKVDLAALGDFLAR